MGLDTDFGVAAALVIAAAESVTSAHVTPSVETSRDSVAPPVVL
jgi:hypothetical protein